MKKNNKGFSLVELIVVVLIMAIIAVALAPQVMKWVENSRKSTDCSNYDTLYEACGVALTNKDIYAKVYGTSGQAVVLSCSSTNRDWKMTSGPFSLSSGDIFYDNIKAQLGDKWEKNLEAVASVLDAVAPAGGTSQGTYTITITTAGTVERTLAPDDSKIS